MDLNHLSFEFGQEIPATWSFGLDVLDGFEQFMDTTPNLDPAVSYGAQRAPEGSTANRASSDDITDTHAEHTSKGRLSAEKKQQNNRAAQKRFRQRQKERCHTIEAQLSETTKQLHELRVRQKQLEARNALLEKVAKLTKQPSGESPAESSASPSFPFSLQADAERALSGVVTETERGPVITFTVEDHDLVMTVEEVGKISSAAFQRLYSTYARKLGACLLELSDSESSSAAAEDMHRWITELTSLTICVSLGNPKGLKAFHSASMDGSSATVNQLPDSFYEDLLNAVELSEAQIQDLLHLRRLFCGKIGQLGRARKALMSQLPSESIGASHASDKLDQVTSLAEQLRANGSEEYRTYMQYASTFYRGIITAKQHAIGIVHSYPFIPEKHRLLELLVAIRHEPTVEALTQSTGLDDLQHAANWQQIDEYLKTVTVQNMHQYIPLIKDNVSEEAALSLDSDQPLDSFL
ncbi:hypothetical protein ABBQ38_006844 [Trebouxia sp. C0009 RCD-2024]